MGQTIIEVSKLTKQYGKATVVDGVSFAVEQGEILGILGPNGAGKTTTLEMIETLRPIDGGSASIDGIDVAKDPGKIRQIIGIQTQASAFYDKVTLVEYLNLLAAIYAIALDATSLLAEVDLSDKAGSYPEKLSGGQQQRFSLAAALVNNPKVLFLDEPTTGLDPQARRNVWELIKKIRERGITIVLTSHYMEEAELLCDRIAIMDGGRIIALDTPDNLINELIDQGFHKQKQVRQADLEDVFISLTGRELRD
ncbi:ABC transporter ATP-binding protein [Bifidobacterium sp.]|jgi:ABC-2 type transport system ATP-binding protein|uniref:ABC transporter ATP-binding protein n=1 Tax=Bifidobacterium sp. TaxID=41200 RepID=UPI0025C2B73A|nr:ABC transporter ATP-binding protein [Bifidobacterium sp.]MCH4209992.1 ABC transporter ATP-binding protein [Bifidobacterium sp.]